MTKEQKDRRLLSLDAVFMDDEPVEQKEEELESVATQDKEMEPAQIPDTNEEEEKPSEAPKRSARHLRRFLKERVSDETREKLEQTERAQRSAREIEALNQEAPIPEMDFSEEEEADDTEDLTILLPTITNESAPSEETRIFAPISVPKEETRKDEQNVYSGHEQAKATEPFAAEEDWPDEENAPLTPAYPDADDEEEKAKEKGVRGFFFNWILPIGVALLLAIVIRFFIGGATTVSGTSMEPTLHNGDFLLVSKIPTYLKQYKRGDILIVDSPDLDEFYVKRLIGLPGETVEIDDGKVYINGKWMKEYYTNQETVSYASSKWTLGENEYFVMGDNRGTGASNDSRLFGPVLAEHIKAVSRVRIWPITKMMLMY